MMLGTRGASRSRSRHIQEFARKDRDGSPSSLSKFQFESSREGFRDIMKNSSEESLFLGEIHRDKNNWQRSDKHGQNQSCLTRNYQERNRKIIFEQAFANFSDPNFGPSFAGALGTSKTGELRMKFFGIWRIRTATIIMNLNSFFQKLPKNPFLKNSISQPAKFQAKIFALKF
jgi:hypothetical protein